MATFRKRGSKWQVQIRTKGQPPLSRSFPTKALAQAWVDDQKGDARAKVPTAITLGSLLAEYLTVTEGVSDKAFIKTFTNRCKFIDKPIAKLTPSDFLAYREEQLKTVKKSSYNRSIKPLVAAFKYGINHKRFPKDCVDAVKSTKLEAKVTKRRRRFPHDEEMAFSAHNSCPTLGAVVTLLVETAMRSGELFLVKKRNVRMGFIYIPQEDTKTKNPRTIALSPRALSAVDVLAAQSNSEKLVALSPGTLKKKFRKVRDLAGLGDLHMHDLRHEALSRMSESGLFGPAELMAMSGHTQLAQLADYIHASPVLIQRKLALLGQSQLSGQPLEAHSPGLVHPQHSNLIPQTLVAQPTPLLVG